jgi:hypothetical protein
MHGAGQRLDVAGGKEMRVGARNDFADAADIGCDQRDFGGGRLQHDVGQTFGAGGHDDAPAALEGLARGHRPGKRGDTHKSQLGA